MKKSKVKRSQNHIFYIIWEWQTESAYFSTLARLCRLPHVTIYTKNFNWNIGDRDPNKKIIEDRIEKVKKRLKEKDVKINKKDKKQHICYLLDTDVYDKNWISHIVKIMEENGINVYFSNRCFEIFLLEHIWYYCKEKTDSKEYIKDIKKFYPAYSKWEWIETVNICEQLIANNLNIMRQNFKKLKKFHNSNWRIYIYDMNPYSEVIDLIEDIWWIKVES